jgi:hypothetical protein
MHIDLCALGFEGTYDQVAACRQTVKGGSIRKGREQIDKWIAFAILLLCASSKTIFLGLRGLPIYRRSVDQCSANSGRHNKSTLFHYVTSFVLVNMST